MDDHQVPDSNGKSAPAPVAAANTEAAKRGGAATAAAAAGARDGGPSRGSSAACGGARQGAQAWLLVPAVHKRSCGPSA